MIVTDKFVFVHLPRSGGTFVSDIIKKFFPSAREIGYHLPLAVLPAEFSKLPVLGTVRNPWSFYPSWFHHHCYDDRYLPLFCTLSHNRNLGFAQTTRNALNLSFDNEKLDLAIAGLPDNFDYQKRHVANLTKDVMNNIRGTGIGLYSFRFNEMFGTSHNIHFCQLETLRSDLMEFFKNLGIVSDTLASYVLRSEKKNTSEHLHYSNYYSQELAELVAMRDRQLIDRFGYVFERASPFENSESSSFAPEPKANS